MGAVGVITRDHGGDSCRRERHLGELRVGSRGVGGDLDHLGYAPRAPVLVLDRADVPVGERVVVDDEGQLRLGANLEEAPSRLSQTQTTTLSPPSCTHRSVTSMPSLER